MIPSRQKFLYLVSNSQTMIRSNILTCFLIFTGMSVVGQEIPDVDQDRLEDTIYMLAQRGMMENG